MNKLSYKQVYLMFQELERLKLREMQETAAIVSLAVSSNLSKQGNRVLKRFLNQKIDEEEEIEATDKELNRM